MQINIIVIDMSDEPIEKADVPKFLRKKIRSTFRCMCVGTEKYDFVINDLKEMNIKLEDFDKLLREFRRLTPEWFEHHQYARRTKQFLKIYKEYYKVDPPEWINALFENVEDI